MRDQINGKMPRMSAKALRIPMLEVEQSRKLPFSPKPYMKGCDFWSPAQQINATQPPRLLPPARLAPIYFFSSIPIDLAPMCFPARCCIQHVVVSF